ncbi:hypothetical protein KIOSHI_191 [Bacillus phage Kioshi]|nr:hypothetical protein KIOSHI_191 [Bacillus phage Kioshi]
MPSSYTEGISSGREHTGRDYLIRFSKGVNALMHMDGKPLESYPEFQKLDVRRYQDKITNLEDELEEVNALGEWGLRDRWRDANQQKQLDFNRAARKDAELRRRYDKVIEEVEAWNPTTERLQRMKTEALNHLLYVREVDCRPVDWKETESNLYKPNLFETPADWKVDKVKSLTQQIEHNKEMLKEEIARTHKNNLFISELISSLEGMGQ